MRYALARRDHGARAEGHEVTEPIFPTEDAIPAEFALPEPVIQSEYLLGGTLLRWDGPMQEAVSPIRVRGANTAGAEGINTSDNAHPRVIGSYPLLTGQESLAALAAAVAAYHQGRGTWPTMRVDERIRHVADFAARMKEEREEVVRLLMWEIGKSLPDSQKEFDRTVAYIEDTIDALKELDRTSSQFVIQEGVIGMIRSAPLGVALCMGPFNYPLNETFTTLIPALVMGNTVILKPPKLGVLLFGPLLEALRDCFPPGVVNTVYGDGKVVVTPLMTSGKVDVLAFIGTSRVADILKKEHPKVHRLRSVLGLEAKNPAIILSDVDLELAVRECVLGCLSFNGQRCTALKVLFVHTSVAAEFLERFTAAIEQLPVGMPWEPHVAAPASSEPPVAITPLPEPDKPAYLVELVADARSHGAKIVNPSGGTVHGSLVLPTVLYPVDDTMRIYHEEQFGPVIPVVPFDDLEIPIRYVVDSDYGQQVSIFGRDPDVVGGLIDPLVNQVCRVNLNSQSQRGPDTFPFTGRKDSAEGTLSVSDALRVFSIHSLVAAKQGDPNEAIIREIVEDRRSNFLSTDFIF
jgi:glyceraldehyde-3-phosphate dehydrogenase (NADP+)